MELAELRKQIDEIDGRIIELVQQRMDVSAGIAEYKRENALPVLDAEREKVKLDAVAGQCRAGMEDYVTRLYREIFSISREYQKGLMERKDG